MEYSGIIRRVACRITVYDWQMGNIRQKLWQDLRNSLSVT
jgi:hypothetical protein